MSRLESRICIVTGAGSGQGRAVAMAFATEGADVLACDIRPEGIASLEREAVDKSLSLSAWVHDVADDKSWHQTVGACQSRYGGVDVLYNNAGVLDSADGGVLELSEATWDRVMSINVKSVFLGARHVIPSMKTRGGGSIVNVASIRAYLGTTTAMDAYAASKAALVGLTTSLAVELGSEQIRCNVICPGTIETNMTAGMPQDWIQPRLLRYPLGRFGVPADVTGLAVFLASPESAWITGTSIPVDGGASAIYV